MESGSREKKIFRVTLAGSAANLVLMVFKFIAGIMGHSAAMIADAFHSLSDFITDIIVLVFVKISSKPQDASHDYGHGKYETLATLLIGLGLVAVAIGIIVSGAVKFSHWLSGENIAAPGKLALWAAIISIVVKELIYRYTISQGKNLDSAAVIANAWHHRSDALSSIGAAIGIGGAIAFGDRWTVLDPLASIVVGAMLFKVAWELLKESVDELTEHSLSDESENEILEIISSFPDVSEPHNLRTRKINNRVAVDLHVRMDGEISLEDAHHRATEIENCIREKFGKDSIVNIHMEPVKNPLTK
ncbi:MAG: cation transporter [Bacteroidales bacterium]|nr:cation transporter [Bacteroidales bacterium]